RESERNACRRDVRTDAEFRTFPRPESDHPAETGNRHALIESAQQKHPLVQRRDAALLRIELPFELPSELRDVLAHVDIAFVQLLHYPVAEKCHTDTRSRQAQCLSRGGRLGSGLRIQRRSKRDTYQCSTYVPHSEPPCGYRSG